LARDIADARKANAGKAKLARSAASGEGERVSLRLPDADYATALSAYELYTGVHLVRDASLQGARGQINIATTVSTKQEIVRTLLKALREQTNIVIEPAADGRVVAKVAPAQ